MFIYIHFSKHYKHDRVALTINTVYIDYYVKLPLPIFMNGLYRVQTIVIVDCCSLVTIVHVRAPHLVGQYAHITGDIIITTRLEIAQQYTHNDICLV